jgi:hypothetical protein
MFHRLRKLVVIVAMTAIAISSGIAPRLAHAAKHAVPGTPATAPHHEAVAPHDEAADRADHRADAAPCHEHGTSEQAPGTPDHGCCVASCSAVAFIFGAVPFDVPSERTERVVTSVKLLRSVSLSGLDPPPRV